MGSKGSQTTSTTQQYTPNANVRKAGEMSADMAMNAAQQPFQMPQAPVAGFTPFQNQAFNQIQGMQGMTQPYFNLASGYMADSAAPISGQDVSNYYNPMAQNVFNQMQNIFGRQMSQTTGRLTQQAGGVGADRIAVGQGILANQQGLAAGQTAAGLYDNALKAAQQQKQMEAGAAFGFGQLGPAAQNAMLTGTGALAGAGSQQQQQLQAQLNAPYQQELARIAYPFQTAQYLAGITGSLGPALGGTTTGTQTMTPAQPSGLQQALGVGMAGLGLMSGNPMMAMGGLGGAMGKGGGSGYGFTGATPNMAMPGQPGMGSFWQGGQQFPMLKRGGPVGYAEGGDVFDVTSQPFNNAATSVVPHMQLQPGAGHSGPLPGQGIDFKSPEAAKQQGPSIDDWAKLASYAHNLGGEEEEADGGAVMPYAMDEGFDEGGGVDNVQVFRPGIPRSLEGRDMIWANMAREHERLNAPHFRRGIPMSNRFEEGGDVPGMDLEPPRPKRTGPWFPSGAPTGPPEPAWKGSPLPTDQAPPGAVPNPGLGEQPGAPLPPPGGGPISAANASTPPPSSPFETGSPPVMGQTAWGRPPGVFTPPPAAPPAPARPAQRPPVGSPAAPYAPRLPNADMNAEGYMMPRQMRPYPDATDRDWGQQMTRSPWMALVKAGATMASTPGAPGTVIGKAIEAGAGVLDQQRKAKTAEETINQRAESLYMQAKRHLDKYQRKTPHEVATESFRAQSLAMGRFTPITYQDKEGNWHTGTFDGRRGITLDQNHQPVNDATSVLPARGGSNTMSLTFNQALQRAAKLTEPGGPRYGEDPVEVAKDLMSKSGGNPVANPNAAKAGPTQADRDWVKAHPEDKEKFRKRFGVEP